MPYKLCGVPIQEIHYVKITLSKRSLFDESRVIFTIQKITIHRKCIPWILLEEITRNGWKYSIFTLKCVLFSNNSTLRVT